MFGAVAVALGVVAYGVVRGYVTRYVDADLVRRAEYVRGQVRLLREREPDASAKRVEELVQWTGEQALFKDVALQVFRVGDDEPLARSPNLGPTKLRAVRALADSSMDGIPITATYDGAIRINDVAVETLRGLRLREAHPAVGELVVIVAADVRPVERLLGIIQYSMLAGGGLGLLSAAAGGYLVSGPVSRRIGRLSNLAKQVSPAALAAGGGPRDAGDDAGDELSDLAKQVNSMLDRLQAGFQAQERFIHNASHELRTPVGVLSAQAQVLQRTKPSVEEYRDFVRSVRDETKRLGRLVDALLLLARARSGHFDRGLTELDPADVCADALENVHDLAGEHRVHLALEDELDPPVRIRGDRELLEAMVANLLRNAVRFSPPGATVQTRLGRDGAEFKLEVLDRGPGVKLDQGRLFERFYEAGDDRARRGGGLGLAIVASVADLHGGRVDVSTRPEGGARFEVRLPIVATAEVRDDSGVTQKS